MKVLVGVSNRHVHLTKEVYETLFDEELEKMRDLDQPGQFAAKQCVNVKVGDRVMENVRIVGPLRSYNQIEISRTDSYKLKVNPPVRGSGDLEGSLPVTIYTAKGKVNLDKGLILANRHIHMTKEDVLALSLKNVETVSVKVGGEKAGILENVYLKVSDEASLRLHLDTDDANAFNLKNNDEVEFFTH